MQGDPRRARLGADGARPDPRDARRRRRGAPLPAAEAVRDQAGRQPHPPARAGRRRQGRDDRRRRDRRGVDGRCRRPRPLARYPRPGARAGRPRAPGSVRGELARGDRRGARGRATTSRPRAGRGRRPDAGRALERQGRRHQRRGALLPRDRLGASARSSSRPPTSFPRPAFTRGALRRRRARRRGPGPGPRAAHRQGLRPRRRAGGLRDAARRRACGCSSTSRRCSTRRRSGRRHVVVGRHGQLRQPLVPAPRRGHAVRLGRALRRRAARGVRARSRALGRDRPGPLARRGPAQRVSETATTLLRREL